MGSALLSSVDRFAIRLNRSSPCVRKTISISGITLISNAIALIPFSPSLIFAHKIPKEFYGLLIGWTYILPMGCMYFAAWKRYGWLARPGIIVPAPEAIRILLASEVADPELPQAHRDETEELLQWMDQREEELAQREQQRQT